MARGTQAGVIKQESDIPFPVRLAHVSDGICQNPRRCTLALAGEDTVGYPVEIVYDERYNQDIGGVHVVWEAPDANIPNVIRIHDGYLEPTAEAFRVMILTDSKQKEAMARRLPPGGLNLTIKHHRSRVKQVRTDEQRAYEAAQRQDLAERRARGESPPPVPRGKSAPVPRLRSSGQRFGTVKPNP